MLISWRKRVHCSVALAAFILLAQPVSADTLSAAQRAAVDAAVTKQLTAQHIPGISLAIERDGQVVYAHGYGYRDVAAAKPVDPDTYFEIGSITKQFTAAAISKLAGEGKIVFDERVSTYLPDVPHASEITVQELLNHTSGLHDYLEERALPFLYSTTATPADLYKLVADLPLDFAPGTQFRYSNTNYVILGALIERVSGMTYGEFLQKNMFNGTPFQGISYGEPAKKTVAYGYDKNAPTKPLTIWSSNVSYAAGGLYATPSDVARWDDAFFSGRVVPPAMVSRLTTPPALPYATKTTYAAGWIVGNIDAHPEIWHNGGIPGFNTSNAYFPEQHLAIVVFGNAVPFVASELTREIFRQFVPLTAAQVAALSSPAAGENAAITARVRELWKQQIVGHIDRTLFTPEASAQLSDAMIAQMGAQLAQLGEPSAYVFLRSRATPAGTVYVYRIVTPAQPVQMTIGVDSNDKLYSIFFGPDR